MTVKPFPNAKAACLFMAKALGLVIDSKAEYGGLLFLRQSDGELIQRMRGYDSLYWWLRGSYTAKFKKDPPPTKA